MKQVHVKGMVIDGLSVVEDFPELNKKLRVATEGMFKILEDVKENFGTERADYGNYREEYQRLYEIVDGLIQEYSTEGNGRVREMLVGIKNGMLIMQESHQQGYFSKWELNSIISSWKPSDWKVEFWD